jgi:hypothetical protein
MTAVSPADNTVTAIRKKVRRLTASPSESTLSTADIDNYINTFYNNDFPYAIKIDQMRSVYTFYTQPYVDRYPLDVNYNQGVREPVYFDGIQGYLYKNRDDFFRMWPRWPTKFQPISGNGITQQFNFTIGAFPILPLMVTLGGTDTNGNPIQVADDGNGNLNYLTPNPVVSVPGEYDQVPGMKNLNTLNPGLNALTNVGSVDYVTGIFSVDFSLANVIPASGQMTLYVSQYQTGRPYTLLFWNNEFHIRPIPKFVHKVEVETYLTPVQFMLSTDSPILNQWWQYIAIGAAIKVLEDRQDMEGLQNLSALFDRQEALVLERQGVEEIGQRNATIFSASVMQQGWNNGAWGTGGWY